ncbi:MAG: hypothetical protein QXY62_02775 [Candidatus Altiarchaeota archaeon]
MTRIVLVFLSKEEMEFLNKEKKKYKEFTESEILENFICAKAKDSEVTLDYLPETTISREGKIVSFEMHDKTYKILKEISNRSGLTDDLVIKAIIREQIEKKKISEIKEML